jgi:hypothetical protein
MSDNVYWLLAGLGVVAACMAAPYLYAGLATRKKPLTKAKVDDALETLRRASRIVDAARHRGDA